MSEVSSDSAETQQLLRGIRAGDRRAFDRLFERHRAYLRQVIELRIDPRLKPRFDPSDVVQEAQLDAFERLADYLARKPMPFRVWLRRTAHERLLRIREQHVEAACRAVGREIRLPDRSSLQLAQVLARGPTPSQQASRRELARQVRHAVARLSETDREVLLMRTFEDLSYRDVGHVLGIEPTAARKRHGRALLRLQAMLAEDDGPEAQR